MTFQGGVQKLSGEMQNNLMRGGAWAPPDTSPQNPALVYSFLT